MGVLSWYEIALGQLMPNSWRILLSLAALSKRFGFNYSVNDLLYSYYLRRHDSKMGRFQLVPNPHKVALISGLTSSDKNWKSKMLLFRLRLFLVMALSLDFLYFGNVLVSICLS